MLFFMIFVYIKYKFSSSILSGNYNWYNFCEIADALSIPLI